MTRLGTLLTATAAGALAAACATTQDTATTTAAPTAKAAMDLYVAGPIVYPAQAGDDASVLNGVVFEDVNRNGLREAGEPGVAGVKVTNGRDVVVSDASGAYALPVMDDMDVVVVQPSGYRAPTNADWVPQISYAHKPAGTPKPLRYGGLPATGPLPSAIDFPLIKAGDQSAFTCAILGDTQTYANAEIGYLRDSVIDDILDRGPGAIDCLVAVGDVMGDDLGLIPRMADVIGALGVPQWWAHGNHDFDFDADSDADSADSWRRLWGPANYAFEKGDTLFIVLDNVVYPCGPEDAQLEGREYCIEAERKRYNARLTDNQLLFVEGLLANTDPDKTVVFAHHIPFVSFVDQVTAPHQTDNVAQLYALVEGREALSLSGHTHTMENLAPGDSFPGWTDRVGIDALPFRHIVAGAGSGAWYQGDFDEHGTPMALQRLGAPRGWVSLDFTGPDYVETYHGANMGRERAMWLSFNTPGFRNWFEGIVEWALSDEETRDPRPPYSINDLPDVKILTPEDLADGTWLTANIWAGDSATTASGSINGGAPMAMTRTQEAQGEEPRIGAEWADPFAVQRQLSVARYALESTSGVEGNQGWQAFQGRQFGPASPQPQRSVADRNIHLWRLPMPEGLPEGAHVATVTVTDRHGREFVDRIAFEVRGVTPPARWRATVWDRFENGPPVR